MTTTLGGVTAPVGDTVARPGLANLVERIRSATRGTADPGCTARRVAAFLARDTPDVGLLTDVERAGSPDSYVRHTLHAESTFSISAVVWRPGQASEIHDHLVWCSFVVLHGTETETIYHRHRDGVVPVAHRRRPSGSVSAVAPPDDIHRVHNTDDTVAITLHVYGADLRDGTSVRRTYDQARS
jgi:predicted metal-dependent enzyme (double-stranded beta helix superfamily)